MCAVHHLPIFKASPYVREERGFFLCRENPAAPLCGIEFSSLLSLIYLPPCTHDFSFDSAGVCLLFSKRLEFSSQRFMRDLYKKKQGLVLFSKESLLHSKRKLSRLAVCKILKNTSARLGYILNTFGDISNFFEALKSQTVLEFQKTQSKKVVEVLLVWARQS